MRQLQRHSVPADRKAGVRLSRRKQHRHRSLAVGLEQLAQEIIGCVTHARRYGTGGSCWSV